MNHERVDETEVCDSTEGTEDTKPIFRVAIVCDDRIAATRAMNVFTGLGSKFGDEFDFQ